MKTLCLNNDWQVHEAPINWSRDFLPAVKALQEGWYDCSLPTDVRIPLIEHHVIKDPIVGDACWDSEWIEQRSWWYRKEFSSAELDTNTDTIELVMDKLDTGSDIFVNDRYIGSHRSVHYPFVRNIKNELAEGINTIYVRITSGLEDVNEEQLAELSYAVNCESGHGGVGRDDNRRAFVRRPQYTIGWDWCPKIVTCGLAGDAVINSYNRIAIREASLFTGSVAPDARIRAMVNVENLNMIGTVSADIAVELSFGGEICALEKRAGVLLTSGYNYVELELEVENPLLWWPAGYGGQPLYGVKISASSGGTVTEFPVFRFGIRTVELDTSPIKGEERWFRLIVNGVPIFCKGGDWIPADSIYARVTGEKITRLIEEAAAANFNMLRIWGGGLYEQDCFYDRCDEHGLLIWHDFMMACSTYPDHHQWFRGEMYKEIDYQTKRLRNHACIGLFCGTNEVHWIFNRYDNPQWDITFTPEKPYGLYISNVLAKEVMHKNCAHIPYWNSSPYGGELPNADDAGDVHRWNNAFMSREMSERIEPKDYDTIQSKFVSEYGYTGPCCLESTREYMGTGEIDRTAKTWKNHCNVFEKGTVDAGIGKNYRVDASALSIEDYILYGGMVHGLMLGYSLEAFRFKDFCGGGLFWMYNDAWGEMGWTIIDYYLRRKIPYYAVKRALAHVKLSMRAVGGELVVQGLNDTPQEVRFKARLGYMSLDGEKSCLHAIEVCLQPRSRSYILREALPEGDYTRGTAVLIPDTDEVDAIWLRTGDMCEMVFEKCKIKILKEESTGEDCRITLHADAFAHGVHVLGDFNCSDNYFDLLPGQTKTILVKKTMGKELHIASVR